MVRPRSLASAACLALLSTLLRAQGKLIFTNSYNKAPDGVEWAADVDGKTARVPIAEWLAELRLARADVAEQRDALSRSQASGWQRIRRSGLVVRCRPGEGRPRPSTSTVRVPLLDAAPSIERRSRPLPCALIPLVMHVSFAVVAGRLTS